jgi:hypothetical protein
VSPPSSSGLAALTLIGDSAGDDAFDIEDGTNADTFVVQIGPSVGFSFNDYSTANGFTYFGTGGGFTFVDPNGGECRLASSGGNTISDNSSTGITLEETGSGPISISTSIDSIIITSGTELDISASLGVVLESGTPLIFNTSALYDSTDSPGISGQVLSSTGTAVEWITSGTVSSVSFTGGLISVATPTTTPAFTVAGTSGGIPYFSSGSTWASSAALPSGDFVLGGGAGTAPTASFSVVPVAKGGTGTGSTLTGLVRGSASAFTASEISGDATTSGSNVLTLATVNSNVGSFTNSSITVNAKGLITAASSGSALPLISTYNGNTTTKAGLPSILATSFLTGNTSAITNQGLVASTPAIGMWIVSYVATQTTAGSVGTVLGGTTGFTITYTNANGDTASKTTALSAPSTAVGTSTSDSLSGTFCAYAGASTAITYSFGYTAGGVTGGVYDIAVYAQFLG